MRIHGAGCCLIDYLYTNVAFSDLEFQKLVSRREGDGGLLVGGLVFAEDLQRFSGQTMVSLMQSLVGASEPDAVNLGGPAVVALIHAAQLLVPEGHTVVFYGLEGSDSGAETFDSFIRRTPLQYFPILNTDREYPSSVVLSDPDYHDGKGERSFINTIGAAASFFSADIVLFGGTALVPCLHHELGAAVHAAKRSGAVTVVGTVYDYLNQKNNPDNPWPLVENYEDIDLLVMDEEEALRISGCAALMDAVADFRKRGPGACIITRGSGGSVCWSNGTFFAPMEPSVIPAAAAVDKDLARHPEKRGDTTGCGDNYLGGAAAAVCGQLSAGIIPDLREAAIWGTVSGGLACYMKGGTWFEKNPGEKQKLFFDLLKLYDGR